MDTSVASRAIKIGDLVVIQSTEEEEDGYITLRGDDSCIIQLEKTPDSVFKILPMTQYTAKKALRERNKRRSAFQLLSSMNQPTPQESEKDEELSQLEKYLKMEEKSNNAILEQLLGKPLQYGQIIQLVHVMTGKLLEGIPKEKGSSDYSIHFSKEGSKKAWFKVMPWQSKFKVEGDKILVGDQVKLVHAKTGWSVHQSFQYHDETNHHRVELTSSATAWNFLFSDLGIIPRSPLKSGQCIRLMHENAGYMTSHLISENSADIFCKPNPTNKIPSSYHNVWQIEEETPNEIGEILWNQPFKFRLLGTDLYLKVVQKNSEGKKKPSSCIILSPTKDKDSLFAFVHIQKEKDETVTLENPVHLQSYGPRPKWVHSSTDSISENIKDKHSELFCSSEYNSNDVFVVKEVPSDQLEKHQFVLKCISPIKSYLEKQSSVDIQNVIMELIQFCTGSNMDPKKDGPPIKVHQSLVEILTRHEIIKLLDLSFIQRHFELSKLIYRLIRLLCKNNHKVSLRFSKGLNLLAQPPTEVWKDAAQCLIEIFGDNPELLFNLTSDIIENLAHFHKLMGSEKHPLFLQLLSTFCICQSIPIPVNQMMICNFLQSHPELLLKTEYRVGNKGKGEVFIIANNSTLSLKTFIFSGDRVLVDYFEQELILFSTISAGRNYMGVQLEQHWIGWKHAFEYLKKDSLNNAMRFRSAYCNIILNCEIDFHPQSNYTNHKYIWSMQRSSLPSKLYSELKTPHDSNKYFCESKKSINRTQLFLGYYVMNKNNFVWDDKQSVVEKWKFFLRVLTLFRYSYSFGHFKHDELLIIPRMKEILQTHIASSADNFVKTLKGPTGTDEETQLLINIKLEACKIIELWLNLRLKHWCEDIKTLVLRVFDVKELSSSELRTKFIEQMSAIHFEKSDLFDLSPVVASLLKHEHNQLTNVAMNLLIRLQRDLKNEVELTIKKTTFLTDEDEMILYSRIQELLVNLRELVSKALGPSEEQQLVSIVEEFTKMCSQKKKTLVQNILREEKLYEDILSILKLHFTSETQESILIQSCYVFLQKFCTGDKLNQQTLLNYVPFLINQRIHHLQSSFVLDTLVSIFQDNPYLCTSALRHSRIIFQLNRLIDLKNPHDLDLFEILMNPSPPILLVQNQKLILKLFFDSKTQSLCKINDITPSTIFSEEDNLYYTKLINLLAICSSDKNKETQSICKNLNELENCIELAYHHLSQNPVSLFSAAFARFITEVYLISAELLQPQVLILIPSNELLWKIFSLLGSSFNLIISKIKSENKLSKDSLFFLTCYFTLIETFYKNHFQIDKAKNFEIEISNKLIDGIISVSDEIDSTIASSEITLLDLRCKIWTTLKIMTVAGITGIVFFGKLNGILQTKGNFISVNFQNDDKTEMKRTQKIQKKEDELNNKCYPLAINYIETDYSKDSKPYNLDILVFQLRNHLYHKETLKQHCLCVLIELVKKYGDQIRTQLNQLEASDAILWLLGSKEQSVVNAALDLLIVLLLYPDNVDTMPNENFQQSIFQYFTSRPDESFFKNIDILLQKTRNQIKDAKRIARENNALQSNDKEDTNFKPIKRRNHHVPFHFLSGFLPRKGLKGISNDIAQVSTEILELNLIQKPLEDDDSKNNYPTIQRVFRFLELMCRSPSQSFKNYFRTQDDNYESYNLIKELVQFLRAFESLIEQEMDLALQLFSTLNEMIKDNPDNQMDLVQSQAIIAINRIFNRSFENSEEKELELKIRMVDCLLNLVTKPQAKIVTKIISTLDLKPLIKNTDLRFVDKREENKVLLASLTYRLVKILTENDLTQNVQLIETLNTIEENCKSRIGRIEIVNSENNLERLYFPIPQTCISTHERTQEKISERRKNELQQYLNDMNINWKKPTDKIEGFIKWADAFILDLDFQETTKKKPILYKIRNSFNFWRTCSQFTILILHALIIIFMEIDDSITLSGSFKNTIFGLGIIQILIAFLLFTSFSLKNGYLIGTKGFRKYFPSIQSFLFFSDDEMEKIWLESFSRQSSSPVLRKIQSGFRHLQVYLLDFDTMFYLFYLIFSILGVAVSPFFFVYNLFQIVIRNTSLRTIVKVLKMSFTTLILVGLFILMMIYVFSIFAVSFFSLHFTDIGLYCSTPLQCIATHLYFGIPSAGGLFQSVEPFNWNNWKDTIPWIIYIVAFYIAIGLFLLNIFLAVIVDNFGKLRDQQSESNEVQANVCFICSVERESFKRHGLDFNEHLEVDHNPLNYLYYFVYLRNRIGNSRLSESENYIVTQAKRNKLSSIFPIERSISLELEVSKDEEKNSMTSIKQLESAAILSSEIHEKLLKENKELRGLLNSLLEEVNKIKKN